MAWKHGHTESPKNSLLKVLSIEGKPLELFSESIDAKIEELYRIGSWSGRRWRGWWRRTGRTATSSAAPCSTPTSAQSSGRCCTRPGAISTLYLRYIYIIYILSTTIYRSGLVPLLPGGCLVPDGAADSANNRNTRGLGPNMRRRQSLPIGQHTPELVCSYISNCEVFIPFQLTLFLYYFQQRTT